MAHIPNHYQLAVSEFLEDKLEFIEKWLSGEFTGHGQFIGHSIFSFMKDGKRFTRTRWCAYHASGIIIPSRKSELVEDFGERTYSR